MGAQLFSLILLKNILNCANLTSLFVVKWKSEEEIYFSHIYCILNGGEVFSIPLFPFEAPHILPFSETEKMPTTTAIAIEAQPENSRLISLTQTGSILAINIVNQSVTDLRVNMEIKEMYSNIKKAHLFDGRLFWISTSCGDTHSWDSCLYGEKYDVEEEVYIFLSGATFFRATELNLSVLNISLFFYFKLPNYFCSSNLQPFLFRKYNLIAIYTPVDLLIFYSYVIVQCQ